MKKILLDTNAYTAFLAGDENVLDVLADAQTTYMSIIVLGELYGGFKGGNQEQRNKGILASFLQKSTVISLDATSETAEIFGTIKNALKNAGTPLPINDVWISAHTVETGAVLITYDSHFRKIPGLRVWDHL